MAKSRYKAPKPSPQQALAFEVGMLSDEAVFDRLKASGSAMFSSDYDCGPVGSYVYAFALVAKIVAQCTRTEFLAWERATFPEYPSMLDSSDAYFWQIEFPAVSHV